MISKSPFRSVSGNKIKKSVKTISSYSRRLFSVSGVNGVSHVAQAKTNTRRALWILVFGFSILGWFYQTTTLLEYYYKYPTVVKIEVDKPPIMDFPGLTICNMNKVRKSLFCKVFPDRCETKGTIEFTEEEVFEITFDFMKRGKKHDLGHQKEDIIVSCEFSGVPPLDTESCLEYFDYIYDPHLGNCLTMSSDDKEKLKVAEPDAWQTSRGAHKSCWIQYCIRSMLGLLGMIAKNMKLTLNVEKDEYLDSVSTEPGFIVAVHEDMAYPHLSAHGIHVYAGHAYNLAVQKATVYLLPHPYKSNCTDYDKLPFRAMSKLEPTPRICSVECLVYYQHKECGHGYVSDSVVLFSEEMPYDADQVNEEDKNCAERLSESYKEYCSTLCGVPCHDVHFTMSIDSSPTSDHKLVVNESVIEEYKKRTHSDKQLDVLELKIHYQSMEHRIFRHSPEYSTEELFSYLGGITGGWLGISLLEFFAFVEGVMSVIFFSFRYCKPKNRNKKKKGKKSPKKVSPIFSRHCNCHCNEDFGSLLLAFPVSRENTARAVQVVPFEYY